MQVHLLIQEVLDLLRATLPATIALQTVIDPDAGSVLADPTQIHQVILNLCTNAAQAMRETGGVIEILEPVDLPTDCSTVTAALKAGPYVRLTVRDSGHGMAPEIMERIFEPFFTTKNLERDWYGAGGGAWHCNQPWGGHHCGECPRAGRDVCSVSAPPSPILARPRSTSRSRCSGGMSACCLSMMRRLWSTCGKRH